MSDPGLLDAFRKQCATFASQGRSPWLLLLMWQDQPDVDRDDLIDICKQFDRPSPDRPVAL